MKPHYNCSSVTCRLVSKSFFCSGTSILIQRVSALSGKTEPNPVFGKEPPDFVGVAVSTVAALIYICANDKYLSFALIWSFINIAAEHCTVLRGIYLYRASEVEYVNALILHLTISSIFPQQVSKAFTKESGIIPPVL